MLRRDFIKAALLFAAERYARAAKGLAALKITDVRPSRPARAETIVGVPESHHQ